MTIHLYTLQLPIIITVSGSFHQYISCYINIKENDRANTSQLHKLDEDVHVCVWLECINTRHKIPIIENSFTSSVNHDLPQQKPRLHFHRSKTCQQHSNKKNHWLKFIEASLNLNLCQTWCRTEQFFCNSLHTVVVFFLQFIEYQQAVNVPSVDLYLFYQAFHSPQ